MRIRLIDVNGMSVRTLIDEVKNAGRYAETFNVSSIPVGKYLLTIEKGCIQEKHKIIVIR